MSLLIPLVNTDLFAVVDDEDYDRLRQHSWYLIGGYAARTIREDGKRKTLRMTRSIITTDSPVIDHIDGDRLNNTKSNLRPATYQENAYNRSASKTGRSAFKGVNYLVSGKRRKRWRAQIYVDGSNKHLGYFDTELEAAAAYDAAARSLHGSFGRLNNV